ncbi:type VI secretion system baseplate subunit TssF [Acinetobacter gerneri]|uniref:type VI secretion system baseplate subunit TssF n=1 Tax=Acinetobacter gerneri TaxID=202952 RepID=UPI0028AAA4C3|nr:type VI secretion system baseplate subunit TssF [Acinetobacter gerneri]
MIDDLLPYYEKQLQEFGQQSREFAQKYPKLAQRLSLNQEQIDDPHIERLIQAFSLIAARIDKKLADSYKMFTRSIFEVMFPQYLRHFPACSIISFEDMNKQKKLTEALIIEPKEVLRSKSFKNVQCEFATTRAVHLLPIQLINLEFVTNPSSHIHMNQNATLSFAFEIFNKTNVLLAAEKLPIYLDAISNFPLQVLDAIFKQGTTFSIKTAKKNFEIPNPFDVIGFEENQSLLPIDQHTHHAYRMLMEYFCFADKFSYLNLDLGFLKHLKDQSNFELNIHLKLNLNDQTIVRNYSELNIANFKLFTCPVVNLFEKQAEPQKINHKQLEYPLLADAQHPELFRVYSVINMEMVREKTNKEQISTQIHPFFAMSHYRGDDANFFYALNPIQYANQHIASGYSIISKRLNPYEIKSDFISTRLLCSNGDLPNEALAQSHDSLTLKDANTAREVVVLKRPNASFQFERNMKEQWRIISHLSLNTLALMKGDALSHIKELLELYNLPKTKENHQIINSIREIDFSVDTKLIEKKPFPMFIRGVKVSIKMDAQIFRGHSLYIFSQLLSHIFSLKVQLNSFVHLSILDSNTDQELYQCIQNIGGKKPL